MNPATRRVLSLALLVVGGGTLVGYVKMGRSPSVALSRDRNPAPVTRSLALDQAPAGALTGDLLVDLKDDARAEQIAQLERELGVKLEYNSIHARDDKLLRIKAPGRSRLRALLDRLRKNPLVEVAEPDVVYHALPVGPTEVLRPKQEPAPAPGPERGRFVPNDPQYKFQWHLDQIGMPEAWTLSQGEGAVVAVIDTGVAFRDRGRFRRVEDLAHTEFVPGYNFVAKNANPEDDHGHGTHVAGTIAQSTHNGVGVAGVAYKAKIMPLKVLSASGSGSVGDIADAIRYAADHGAHVINMSLGGPLPSKVMAKAIAYAHSKGVTVVCAAGNDGHRRVGYPAASQFAVAVAATQFDETTTFYSNYGPEIDLAAPGGNTRVDQNGDGMPDGVLQNTIAIGDPSQSVYLPFMGTSMASPHVAGVAALLVSQGVTDPDALERILKETARAAKGSRREAGKQHDERYGYGIVDAPAAIKAVKLGHGSLAALLAGLLAAVVFGRMALAGRLGVSFGAGSLLALLVGASGLFFLPYVLPAPLAGLKATQVLSSALPAWGGAAFGVAGHGNVLLYSALLPILLTGLAYGVPRLRGPLAALALGMGAHLVFQASFGAVRLSWLPLASVIGGAWLWLNAAVLLGLSYLIARK